MKKSKCKHKWEYFEGKEKGKDIFRCEKCGLSKWVVGLPPIEEVQNELPEPSISEQLVHKDVEALRENGEELKSIKPEVQNEEKEDECKKQVSDFITGLADFIEKESEPFIAEMVELMKKQKDLLVRAKEKGIDLGGAYLGKIKEEYTKKYGK